MITVGHCGYDSRHRTRLEMRRPGGTPDYTLLLIKRRLFPDRRKTLQTPPGTVILYEPSVPVHYGSVGASYNDDWIHFLPEDCDLPFLQELKLPCNTPCTLSFTGQLSEYARMIVLEKIRSIPTGNRFWIPSCGLCCIHWPPSFCLLLTKLWKQILFRNE